MNTRSVARRLALVLLALGPPVLIVTAATWAWKKEESVAQEQVHAAAKQLAGRVDAELERSLAVLNTIASSNVMQTGDLKAFHELARRIVQREPQFENVQLFGTKGEHLVNARLPYNVELPPLNRPELPMRAAMLGEPVVSDVEMAVVAKRMLTVIYVPVAKDGKVTHVVGAAIEPPNWSSVLSSVLPVGVDALLLDRSNFVITSTPGLANGAASGPMQNEPALARPGDLLGDIQRMRSASGSRFYVAEENSRVAGWKILAVVPPDHAGLLHKHWAAACVMIAVAMMVYLGLLWLAFGQVPTRLHFTRRSHGSAFK